MRACNPASGRTAPRQNTNTAGAQVGASTESQTSRLRLARPTASRLANSMTVNGTPQLTVCGEVSVDRSPSSRDSIAASTKAVGGSGPNSGSRAVVSWAHTGLPRRPRIVTGTGPTPSSNTTRVASPASAMSPMLASTCAVPMVGWPAKGSSAAGVKMRRRRVCPGRSGGRTKTVSDRLSSRATACICRPESPAASGNTASGLPPKM